MQSAMLALDKNKSVLRSTLTKYSICAFAVGFLLFSSIGQRGVSVAAALGGAASAAIFFVCFPALLRLILKRRAIRMAESNRAALLGRRSFSLTKKGLRLWGDSLDKIYAYDTMERVEDQKGYLNIHIKPDSTLSLPHRAFADEEQRRQFLELLRGHMAQG